MDTPRESPLDDVVGAAAIAATLALSPLLSGRYRRWGATIAECRTRYPGDDHVKQLRMQSTRAITIDAPPSVVWSWLVQIGHGRAGLYSYERLENLAGCQIENAWRVEPSWQSLAPGDAVHLGPEGYPSYRVAEVAREQHLVLVGGDDPAGPQFSWAFVLVHDGARTRLVVRSRYGFPRTVGQRMIWRVITEPIHFVMERRMLLGIKQRAERSGHETSPRSHMT
jgi:hypothetical protein